MARATRRRTPLAVVTAQAHVMAHADSAGARLRACALLNQAIARASHVAQQLLTLATLDDAQAPAGGAAHGRARGSPPGWRARASASW